MEAGEDLGKSDHGDSIDSRSETTRVVAAQNPQSDLEKRKDYVMEDCIENPTGCQQDSRQIVGNKRKALAKNKSKGIEGLGVRSSKGSKSLKSHKWLTHNAKERGELILSSKGLGSDNQVESGEDFDRVNPTAKVQVGHLVHEPSDGDSRRDNSSDKSSANGNFGVD